MKIVSWNMNKRKEGSWTFLLEKIDNYKKAFYIGFFFGLGFYISSLYWISISFKIANMGGYFLGSLSVLILCAFLSLFSALTFYLIKRFSVKDNIFFNSIIVKDFLTV